MKNTSAVQWSSRLTALQVRRPVLKNYNSGKGTSGPHQSMRIYIAAGEVTKYGHCMCMYICCLNTKCYRYRSGVTKPLPVSIVDRGSVTNMETDYCFGIFIASKPLNISFYYLPYITSASSYFLWSTGTNPRFNN